MEAAISRRPGRPARLSRESVLRAAVEVADEGGIEALTMQRVGEAVGAEAMSLYRHVRNKEDLIDGAVDLVFAEIELPPTDTDWRSAMRTRAASVREVLRRHPWAVGLMDRAPCRVRRTCATTTRCSGCCSARGSRARPQRTPTTSSTASSTGSRFRSGACRSATPRRWRRWANRCSGTWPGPTRISRRSRWT